MWRQILTIAWAQWRVMRNHLPRTTFGSLLGFALSLIWYGGFATLAVFVAFTVPAIPLAVLQRRIGPALMLLFFVWQLIPLVTLSSGWSLELKKLQVFPLYTNTMLAAEALLRISGSLETVLVAIGATLGLIFHPAVRVYDALALALYIPFNLLVSVAVREVLARLLQRNRVRELVTILVIAVAVLPQFLIRLGYAHRVSGALRLAGNGAFTPWQSIGSTAVGIQAGASLLVFFGWMLLAYWTARRQLLASLRSEESQGSAVPVSTADSKRSLSAWLEYPARWFPDPVGAIVSKEIRTLMRMPRFRVIFTLATLLTVVIILPLTMNNRFSVQKGSSLVMMECNGLMILGDALLWNIFGFDGRASQLYFAAPVDIRLIFRAKNVAAGLFAGLQIVFVLAAGTVLKLVDSPKVVLIAILSGIVLALYFMSLGNVSSVVLARRVDPRATMKKQAGAKAQFWIFVCMLAAVVLIGFAFLAGWALATDWGTLGVLAAELGIGILLYRFSIESAVGRALSQREELLTALSKGGAAVSS